MSTPTLPITLDVDLTNPGQFLACCGLFELASRLDAEAVAWFEGAKFNVDCRQGNVLESLLNCRVQPTGSAITPLTKPNGKPEESPPVWIDSPFNFLLDWWEDEGCVRAGFKTWAGGQKVIGFIDGMRGHIKNVDTLDHSLLVQPPAAINKPKPFYFDSRISRLTSLNLGYSAEKFITAFSPSVELLALVGLQRFRPSTVIQRESYAFATWKEPLHVSVAAAASAGLVPALSDRRYTFRLVIRTGEKYKAFGPATLERSIHV